MIARDKLQDGHLYYGYWFNRGTQQGLRYATWHKDQDKFVEEDDPHHLAFHMEEYSLIGYRFEPIWDMDEGGLA